MAGIVLAAASIVACGGSKKAGSGPMAVHLDGHATGDYVREISGAGTGFLVPTSVLSEQGRLSFDIASPPVDTSGTIQLGPRLAFASDAQARRGAKKWFTGPSVTGNTPERARVELLVTGDPGRRIYLSFEESCGFSHLAPGSKGQSAVAGAHGQRILRTPAVMIVPTLTSKPENSCYVSGVVVTRGTNHLHISLIDY